MQTRDDTLDPKVAQQLALESETLADAARKYREMLREEGHGNTRPGLELMRAALAPTAEKLRVWIEDVKKGRPDFVELVESVQFLDQFEPEVLAWCVARTVISSLHERPEVKTVARRTARMLAEELNVEAILEAQPALGKRIAEKANKYAGRGRAVFIRRGTELADVEYIKWDDVTEQRVGTALVKAFCDASGLVVMETVKRARDEQHLVLLPTEECAAWLENKHAGCELLTPMALPMVCPPRPWTKPTNGGYLTPKMRKPMIKTRNNGYLSELKQWDMPHVYAAVNALQDTRWSVNESVYRVVKTLWESDRPIGGLPSRAGEPLPAKSWAEGEEPNKEVLKAWKQRAAQVYGINAAASSKRLQLTQKLWVAEKMMELGNEFHFVYNLDWRGRAYPVAAGLSPQGDDVAKGLLQFAEAVPLGENGAYWLAVHLANSWGVDKVSFEDRIAWVSAHETMITGCGNDPLRCTQWAEADAPFVFLAACMEYARLQEWVENQGKAQEEFPSCIPVAFDGACNGLQNYSALLRDEVGGLATGLVPSEKPADIYKAVAEAASDIVEEDAAAGNEVAARWIGKITRRITKRNTMTQPYGVTAYGMRDQLMAEFREIVKEGNPDNLDLSFESAVYLADVNYKAIGKVVVAARVAMDWLRKVAHVAAEEGLPIHWEAPSGLLVNQAYRVAEGESLCFRLMGRRFCVRITREGHHIDIRRQTSGIAPNFIHSLDASHLVRTVLYCAADGIEGFAMVHDSFGTHAGHAETLRNNLRRAFVDQYREPLLEQFRDEIARQLPEEVRPKLPPVPRMGTLELAGVLDSEYFFA